MIGLLSGAASLVASAQNAKQAISQAEANRMRAAYYERHPEMVEAMRNALALEQYKQGNVGMAYQPFHRAKTFTDEAFKLMEAEPEHREEIKAHAIECLRQFPDQQVAAHFIEQLLTA